VKESYIA